MDIKKNVNELSKIEKEGENKEIISYREAYDELDFDELKLFTVDLFGNDFKIDDLKIDDFVKNIIENPLTEVVSASYEEANGELVESVPVILHGIISILDLSQTSDSNLLRKYLLNLSERYSSDSFGKTIAKFFLNTKNNFKLLFYNRKDYASPQLCHYLLSNLNDSIESIEKDDHFLFISKVFKANKKSDENQETKTIIWLNVEDIKFAEQATDYLEYPVDSRIVSGFPKWGCPFAPNKWNPEDYTNAEPWRIIYFIQLNKLDTIYKNVKDIFNNL